MHTTRAMGAQQGKERERTSTAAGSLHSLTLSSTPGSRPVKPKTNSLRPARENSSASRSQAFNVFVEHNGMSLMSSSYHNAVVPSTRHELVCSCQMSSCHTAPCSKSNLEIVHI